MSVLSRCAYGEIYLVLNFNFLEKCNEMNFSSSI